MSNRTRRADERAEARRRARYAAMGRTDELTNDEDATASRPEPAPQQGGSFLTRLFPPAPPLPGKPDPLAGFTYDGPLRGVVSALYLRSRHPVPWLGLGAVWAIARLLMEIGPLFGAIAAILGSLIAFGTLIAAGWIGWQRPWLYGFVASIVGILLFAAIFASLMAGAQSQFTPGQWFVGLINREVVGLQPLFGALAGWYGGYLRRRMAAASASARQQGSRRR